MVSVKCTGICKGNCNISAHTWRLLYITTDRKEPKIRAAQSDIFKGCRIVFNGRTGKVSSYYLAKLVQEHGGNVASTLTSTRVTHMVGSNLNGSKADKVLKSSGKVKFVSPGWILQSIKNKKRQPEFEFLVYKDSHAAGSLRAAFSRSVPSSK
ncbi:DNA repair protein REV1 [Phytophthora nicotianae]|uniref:DNA repair protein REV1 n=1 Tax=Phytophthora nicotianae TaxID=4792 RepID=A0A0W8CJ59_PHYNI|nr:DNA repair protein REV1 [Phytophthora nicotianae]